MWSKPPLSSMRPSSTKVRACVGPEWAWKHPTQVEVGTDHTLTSPDIEPEQSMEGEEKERLRTECLWPDRDWGNRMEINEKDATSSGFHIDWELNHTYAFTLIFFRCIPVHSLWWKNILKKLVAISGEIMNVNNGKSSAPIRWLNWHHEVNWGKCLANKSPLKCQFNYFVPLLTFSSLPFRIRKRRL